MSDSSHTNPFVLPGLGQSSDASGNPSIQMGQPGRVVASDGIAGLAMAGRLEPDVLLIDILLPGIDGAALITSLRSHPQFARSRLIVITALDEAQRAPYAFALEGVPVVHKTALVVELPPLLRQVLQSRRAAPATA